MTTTVAPDQDLGELPVEFHERLAQLLRVMPGSMLAGVRPGKQPDSWVVAVAFPDRVERAHIIYAPDRVAV